MKLTELLKMAALISLQATEENPDPDVDFYAVINVKLIEKVSGPNSIFLNLQMGPNVLGEGYLADCQDHRGDFDIRLDLLD